MCYHVDVYHVERQSNKMICSTNQRDDKKRVLFEGKVRILESLLPVELQSMMAGW